MYSGTDASDYYFYDANMLIIKMIIITIIMLLKSVVLFVMLWRYSINALP